MSLDAALSIADSGLAAINAQLGLVSHNVANASTPGYATETAALQTAQAEGLGTGVLSAAAQRDVDQALQAELLTQNATTSGLATRTAALTAIDTVQGTPGQGQDLPSLLGNLRNAFSTLLDDPSNATQQASVVQSAGDLASAINTLSNAYTTQRQDAQNAIVSEVGTINASLSTIGSLSDQIIAGRAAGRSTADLENQRDAAIGLLSSVVGINTLSQANGDVVLTTTGGVSLPIHGVADPLGTTAATVAPGAFYPGGGVSAITLGGTDVTASLQGGALGANIVLRDGTLPTYQAELDEFSQNLAAGFAARGLPLLTDAAGDVPASAGPPTQSGYVGFAGLIQVNTAISADPAAIRDGLPSVNAPAAAGFSTVINNVLNNVLGNAPVLGGNTSGLGPTGSLQAPFAAPSNLTEFASSIVGTQAADSAAASAQGASQKAVRTSLQSQLSGQTGVNLDAQMTNLIALQNAYSANAKVIGAVQTLFTALLDMVKP